MKKAIISMSVVLLACSATFASASEVGRWQMLELKYPYSDLDGKSQLVQGLFKLDTVTGDLYSCESGQLNGEVLDRPGTLLMYSKCLPFEKSESYPNAIK